MYKHEHNKLKSQIRTQKPGIPLVNTKNSQFQEEAKKSVQEISKLIQHNFDVTVVQEALKIVNNLQKLRKCVKS